MNIVLAGYGKMGKMIESIVLREQHDRIVLRVTSANKGELQHLKTYQADVVIDFSKPDVILENINAYINQKIPAVIGTTGWYHQINEIHEQSQFHQASIVWGSNFSIGVNLFFRINQYAATLLKHYPEYHINITETHHKNKMDKPSGTAQILSHLIQQNLNNSLNIPVESIRDENSVGRHSARYHSTIDEIELIHNAHNREGFAVGSLKAASWIIRHQGFYNFADIFEQL